MLDLGWIIIIRERSAFCALWFHTLSFSYTFYRAVFAPLCGAQHTRQCARQNGLYIMWPFLCSPILISNNHSDWARAMNSWMLLVLLKVTSLHLESFLKLALCHTFCVVQSLIKGVWSVHTHLNSTQRAWPNLTQVTSFSVLPPITCCLQHILKFLRKKMVKPVATLIFEIYM